MQQWKRPTLSALMATSLFFNTSCFTLLRTTDEHTQRTVVEQQKDMTTYGFVNGSFAVDDVTEAVYFRLVKVPAVHTVYRQEEHTKVNGTLNSFGFAAYMIGLLGLLVVPSQNYTNLPSPINSQWAVGGGLLGLWLLDSALASSLFPKDGEVKVLGKSEETETEKPVAYVNGTFELYNPENNFKHEHRTDAHGQAAVHVTWYDAEAGGFHIKMPGDTEYKILRLDNASAYQVTILMQLRQEKERAARAEQERIRALASAQRQAYINQNCKGKAILARTLGTTVEELAKTGLDKLVAKRFNMSEDNAGRIRNLFEATVLEEDASMSSVTVSALKNEFDNGVKGMISDDPIVAEVVLQFGYALLPCL